MEDDKSIAGLHRSEETPMDVYSVEIYQIIFPLLYKLSFVIFGDRNNRSLSCTKSETIQSKHVLSGVAVVLKIYSAL